MKNVLKLVLFAFVFLFSSTCLVMPSAIPAADGVVDDVSDDEPFSGMDESEREKAGITSLMWASVKGDVAAIQTLIAAGTDVNEKTTEEWTSLHAVAAAGGAGCVESMLTLLQHGANATATNIDKETPLHFCAHTGSSEVQTQRKLALAKILITYQADVHARDKHGQTPLHVAARWGSAQLVGFLCDSGADVTARDELRRTPLDLAQNGEMVRLLAAAGADVNAAGESGFTLLHTSRGADVIKALLELGAILEARNNTGKTPLHWVSANGSPYAIKALIEAGADREARDNTGKTPLHWASANGSPYAIKALIEAGADREARDNTGMTPLHWASVCGNNDFVKALTDAGANREARDNTGMTPLHWASLRGLSDAITALVRAGTDLEARDNSGCTPLFYACLMQNKDVAKNLLYAGADKNTRDFLGRTPLHIAVCNVNEGCEVVHLLLEHGADRLACDSLARMTPLHLAAASKVGTKNIGVVMKALLDKDPGALNLVNARGKTPLMYAVESGCVPAMVALIEAGADTTIRDKRRLTARDYENAQLLEMVIKAKAPTLAQAIGASASGALQSPIAATKKKKKKRKKNKAAIAKSAAVVARVQIEDAVYSDSTDDEGEEVAAVACAGSGATRGMDEISDAVAAVALGKTMDEGSARGSDGAAAVEVESDEFEDDDLFDWQDIYKLLIPAHKLFPGQGGAAFEAEPPAEVSFMQPTSAYHEWLATLSFLDQKRVELTLARIDKDSYRKHFKHLGDGLYEIRLGGTYALRIYARFAGSDVILLDGGDKNTQRQQIKHLKASACGKAK